MAEATALIVLDQLGESLILSSAALARVRRASRGGSALEREVQAVDEAFSRSISLARALRERLLASFDGEYASLANAAREVVRRLHATLDGEARISLHCDVAPVVVTGTAAQLRYIVGALLNRALELDRDVAVLVRDAWSGSRRVGELVVRYRGDVDEERRELAHDVQAAVSALGGALAITADRDHTLVVIQVRAAAGE